MPETRDLPVTLTAEEKAARAVDLSQAMGDYEAAVESKKLTMAEARNAVEIALNRAKRLGRAILEGVEVRPVEVALSFDRDHARAITTRSDTGAVIEARPMTAREIEEADQGVLFGPDATVQAVAVADAMDEAAARARSRAEFSLLAWNAKLPEASRLPDEALNGLIEGGLTEVGPLLALESEEATRLTGLAVEALIPFFDALEAEYEGPVDAFAVMTAAL